MSEAPDTERSARDDVIGPGIALRRAREARGLQIADIARSLHLDPWMIQALEEDDFDALGAPVFAKGHLRQYGSLLGLESDDLMIAYYRVRGRADAPPPPITATMARPERRRGMLLAGIVLALVVIAALAALLWFVAAPTPDGAQSRPAEAAAARSDDAAPAVVARVTSPPPRDPLELPDPADTTQPGDTLAPAGDLAADESAPTTEEVTSPVSAQPAADLSVSAEPVPATAPMQLVLRFGTDSWVEVYDADGERLLYAMGAAGRSRTVTGAPPLEVYLGRSRDVVLEVDGAPYTIAAESIRGNTARFRIER